ncbi:MAG: hypothetical protein AB1644_12050 [Candidatus Zixiibacteriota bacterium]
MISPSPVAVQETLDGTPSSSPRRRLFLWALYGVSFALLIWFFAEGLQYYMTPYAERPHHADYRVFRPAGTHGLTYGIVGATMMVLMLGYTMRKRTRLLGRAPALRYWLDLHIYFGVIGPLFIVLHTSFKVQGLVAVGFWSMVAVAASGYFGRYLYMQIPRNIAGNELTLQEMEQASTHIADGLKERFRLDDETLKRVDALFEKRLIPRRHGALTSALILIGGDLARPFTKRELRRRLRRIILLPKNQFMELFETEFRRALLRRRIGLLSEMRMLFHYWHVIHKPFAIVMYIVMAIHIGVALWTGYGWIG